MRAAVIANPAAGQQNAQSRILLELRKLWHEEKLYGVAGFGGELSEHTLPEPEQGRYLDRFHAAMNALTDTHPEVLVTVGGDGTAAYAAEYLLEKQLEIPILGIGAGTANVGPIVSEHDAEHLPLLQELQTICVGAVEAVSSEGRHIAYGFNDLVLGNTLLGPVDGQTVTLDTARKSALDLDTVKQAIAENEMYSVAFDQLPTTWAYTHFTQMGNMDMLMRTMLNKLEKGRGTAQELLDKAASDLADEIAEG